MKAQDINVGNHYIAKVNNRLTVVKVTESRIDHSTNRKTYLSENLLTGRVIFFRSAGRFRRSASQMEVNQCLNRRSTNQ